MYISKPRQFLQPSNILGAILRNVRDAIITIDCDGIVTFMNPSAEALTGWTQASSLGQDLDLVFRVTNTGAKSDCSAFDLYLDRGYVTLVAKDKTETQIEQSVSPLEDEQGIKSGYVIVFRPVSYEAIAKEKFAQVNQTLETRIQELEEELLETRGRYCALFNSAADSIFVHEFTEDHKPTTFTEVNDAACEVLGYTREELLQLGVKDIIPPPKICDDVVFQKFKDKDRRLFEIEHIAKDRSSHPVEVRVNIFEVNGKLIGMGVARDITQRKKAEAELKAALEQQRELAELRSQFISMVSHEFRTPLSSILLSAELIEEQPSNVSRDVSDRRFKRIKDGIKRMTQLLEDILIIGKMEAGKMEFNPASCDLEALCLDLMDEIAPNSDGIKRIDFSIKTIEGGLKEVQADERLMRHILSNLLSNAVKYSAKDTTVKFEIDDLKANNSEKTRSITLTIQDCGIGIPSEDLPKLYETFHRAKNVKLVPGTGLGLAIVKNCVNLHGGEITVDSVVGVGTTFTVTIPLCTKDKNVIDDNTTAS
jgi:PAS domain S-box-containing protein